MFVVYITQKVKFEAVIVVVMVVAVVIGRHDLKLQERWCLVRQLAYLRSILIINDLLLARRATHFAGWRR